MGLVLVVRGGMSLRILIVDPRVGWGYSRSRFFFCRVTVDHAVSRRKGSFVVWRLHGAEKLHVSDRAVMFFLCRRCQKKHFS